MKCSKLLLTQYEYHRGYDGKSNGIAYSWTAFQDCAGKSCPAYREEVSSKTGNVQKSCILKAMFHAREKNVK